MVELHSTCKLEDSATDLRLAYILHREQRKLDLSPIVEMGKKLKLQEEGKL